ncbi:M4 family metallopeptidase [Nocardioides sp. NPDC057577]|uniref:M4 family metallopeptidase n=1 Tax=Nocardioides sp. NPDC057577 TaxID=3346171 RepID=UPI00366FFAC4
MASLHRLTALTATPLVAIAMTVFAPDLVPAGHAASKPAPTIATERLHADADRSVHTSRVNGTLRFAGASGGRIENPSVDRADSATVAARAHVDRYGAAFGAARAGTTLATAGTTRTSAGTDVVRLDQRIDGIPVLGGQMVVTMGPDRALASLASSLSATSTVAEPRISESRARSLASATLTRAENRASEDVVGSGRTVFDPAVFGTTTDNGSRSGWRFDVSGADGARRLLIVDDQDGRILLDIDKNQRLDRVVCDNANATNTTDVPCTAPARTETGEAGGSSDVESAFALAGEVDSFYEQIANIDLTNLIGLTQPDGRKSLASTVNWCYTTSSGCPYANAFWNGTQMYYGAGYAIADDVVGHEMTHGVIDQFSQLFYWGQSGAINESIADVMGEIIDHRRTAASDDDSGWDLGEDLPGGAIRSMRDPALHSQPDTMTSATYVSGLDDNGGVHTNSGVGNKTAFLISQGGTHAGTDFAGIDAGDAMLTKTATLYLDVLQRLAPGAEYADLANQLEQSCSDLVAGQKVGFTSSDCATVHQATEVTQLRTNPTVEGTRTDAQMSCPAQTAVRTLFDSETGDAASKFAAGSWTRNPSTYWGPNATSGKDAWHYSPASRSGAMTKGRTRLQTLNGIELPAGQTTYMWFRQWHLFDYDSGGAWDGGVVGWTDDTTQTTWRSGTNGWTNGPNGRIQTSSSPYYNDNPNAGQTAFVRDGKGWYASQVDLSEYAGHTLRPYFEASWDSLGWYVGWFLDDIKVYTCEPIPLANTAAPTITGTPRVGSTLTATPGVWSPAATSVSHQWLRDGSPISGATSSTYTLAAADHGTRVSVRVTASSTEWSAGASGTKASAPTASIALGSSIRATVRPVISGTVRLGSKLTASKGTWDHPPQSYSYTWLRNGVMVAESASNTYTLRVSDVGSKITVRVVAWSEGWAAGSSTTLPTAAVAPGYLTSATPTIGGTRRVGYLLTAYPGTWKPSGITFSYQWLRNGVAISGATGKSYRLRSVDRGDRIRVRVTGRKAGCHTKKVTSAATSTIR